MKQAKTSWETQSKVKYKTWKEKKQRQIKEITIRGLEPEMNKLFQKAEQEKQELKQFYENKLKEVQNNFEGNLAAEVEKQKERLKELKEKEL